jgi:alkylhydroperoxidase/carboxymuconolactone decarboxylase family protein YurZ
MANETPVLDTIAAMTLDSVERCGLDSETLLLVRIAALAAVDAKPASYLLHVGPAVDAGVTIEQVQDVLVAVAPIVGTARTMSASLAITEALGLAIAVIEAEMDEELEG